MRRYQRTAALLTAAVVGLSPIITSSVSPAMAAVTSISPATWGYIDSQAPRTSFVNQSGDAPIGTIADASARNHTYRSFFTFDLTQVKGQVVHRATFFSHETAVTDCSAAGSLELWQTRPLRTTSTWANPPAEVALIQTYNRGAGTFCPAAFLGADLLPLVNAALSRRDPSLTVELRVAAAGESNPALGRRVGQPGLGLDSNHAPTVTELSLTGPDRPCGTLRKHPTGAVFTTFKAKGSDADPLTLIQYRFAVWPVAAPDQRIEFTGNSGFDAGFASIDLSRFADGTELAWAAQASDGLDTSAWSKPCYLKLDRVAPVAPAVGSRLYPEGSVPSGGEGVKGNFRFDAQGSTDVTEFEYREDSGRYWRVPARRDGTAVVEYTPTRWGPQSLYVTAYDAAGNRGATTQYQFWVKATAPYGSVDVAGVGLPSRITLSSTVARVTEFSYQLPGGSEVRFPATDGTGSATITFTATGYYDITIRTYAGTKMVGATTLSTYVSDAPNVESTDFTIDRDAVVGATGHFTFRPRSSDVVSYVYDFGLGDGPQVVEVAADGTATIEWTAEIPSFYELTVQSARADGGLSDVTYYQFFVIDNKPNVYVPDLVNYPRTDGVGRPLDIQFQSYLPDLTGFAYRFNGGPELTVATNAFAFVTVTPDHAGDNTVEVRGLLADGSRTPPTVYTFSVWSGPVVTWVPDGDGTVGKPVTFTFHPGLPGVVRYRYTITDEQTVEAGPDGTASVTYMATYPGLVTVYVTSEGADGTVSEQRQQYYFVRDNRVSVYSGYSEYAPRGGIGSVGLFGFITQLFGEVTEYRYHVNDEPEQSITASTEGTTTYAQIPLNRNGLNTLYVQSRSGTADLSPVTEYRFLVGTAPRVVSAEYPDQVWSGGAGVPGTFEFSGGTAGIVSFEYQLDGAPAVSVSADANGRASVVYTPPNNFETHTFFVIGRLGDGSATDYTFYYAYVAGGS